MIACPSCSSLVSEVSRFCSSCGEPLASSHAPTRGAPSSPRTGSSGGGRSISSDSIDRGRFAPGAMVGERYRIIGLLGRGGMGEVYRADDLTLGQAVALKFLPELLAQDPLRLSRFIAEVRISRTISHPNVCRVYDIGEVDGQ